MSQMIIIYLWDHLVILLRFYLTDAAFLFVMTGIWNLITPNMKEAGHIKALYRLLLLTEAAAFLFLTAGIATMFFPASLFGLTEYFRGQYTLYGLFYLGSAAVIFPVCIIKIIGNIKKFAEAVMKERKLRRLCYPTGKPERLKAYRNLGKRLGLKKLPALFENPGYTFPFIIGMIHPLIVVPFDVFTDDECYVSMSHELVHYKRKDVLFRGLDCVIQVIFWFLPRGEKRHTEVSLLQEVLCDQYVREAFKEEDFSQEYYIHVLNMTNRKTAIQQKVRASAASAGLVESPIQLTDRISCSLMIQDGRKKYALAVFFCLLFVGSVIVVSYEGIRPTDLLSWHALELSYPEQSNMVQVADASNEKVPVSGRASEVVPSSDRMEPADQKADQSSSYSDSAVTKSDSSEMTELKERIAYNDVSDFSLDAACCVSTDWIDPAEISGLNVEIFADDAGCQICLMSSGERQVIPMEEDYYDAYFELREEDGPYKLIVENPSDQLKELSVYLKAE